jgi:hypothetical protein
MGISGIHLEWWIHGHSPNRSFSTDLHLERNKEENKKLFDYLKGDEKNLKKELGNLHFQYPWGKEWARIYVEKSYNEDNHEEVEDIKKWAVEMMVKFYNTFKPKIEESKHLILK